MSDSLGDRVQAVKIVPEFKMFLNAAELNELDDIERGIVWVQIIIVQNP